LAESASEEALSAHTELPGDARVVVIPWCLQ
jgi:hypothetical protein